MAKLKLEGVKIEFPVDLILLLLLRLKFPCNKPQPAYNSGFVQAARPLNAHASQPDTKPPTVGCYTTALFHGHLADTFQC